jgi:hypothetical protein
MTLSDILFPPTTARGTDETSTGERVDAAINSGVGAFTNFFSDTAGRLFGGIAKLPAVERLTAPTGEAAGRAAADRILSNPVVWVAGALALALLAKLALKRS